LFVPRRYAFRSTEKVALQEIGPRFTLKLRSLKKGIPAVFDFGEEPEPLALDEPPVVLGGEKDEEPSEKLDELPAEPRKTVPPKHDEIIWAWKVRITLCIYIHSVKHDSF
jgi:ribosome production factor 1